MSQTYNLATVRAMLSAAFSAGEISTVAFDITPDIYEEFSSGMPKSKKIEMIVDYARRRANLLEKLVEYVKTNNRHQYDSFADKLFEQENAAPVPSENFMQNRLNDLQTNINRHYGLLKGYEEDLTYEDDRRSMAKIEKNIEREKGAMQKYQREFDALKEQVSAQPHQDSVINDLVSDIEEKFNLATENIKNEIKKEITTSSAQLTHEVRQNREVINARADTLAAKISSENTATVETVLAELDKHHIETVDYLLDLIDQQKLAEWEGQQITLLTQQALGQLKKLGKQREEDQEFLAMLAKSTEWSHKVKLCLPLIPGLVTVESEISADLKNTLNNAWQSLIAKIKPKR